MRLRTSNITRYMDICIHVRACVSKLPCACICGEISGIFLCSLLRQVTYLNKALLQTRKLISTVFVENQSSRSVIVTNFVIFFARFLVAFSHKAFFIHFPSLEHYSCSCHCQETKYFAKTVRCFRPAHNKLRVFQHDAVVSLLGKKVPVYIARNSLVLIKSLFRS